MKKSTKHLVASLTMAILAIGCIAFAAINLPQNNIEKVPNEDVTVAYKSGVIEKYAYQDLIDDAPVVVTSHVIDVSEPFQIIPVSGASPSNFTDVTIEVDEVLRGNVAVGDQLTVRVEGGQVDDLDVVVEESPELNVGDDNLLFLYQPGMGGAYNTEGDYYYVLGLYQGTFYLETNAVDVSVLSDAEDNATYKNSIGTTIELNTLKTDLSVMTRSAVTYAENENKFYDEFIENQAKNLQNGFISQEEYDELIEQANEYATIAE